MYNQMLQKGLSEGVLEGRKAFGMGIKNREYVAFMDFRYSFNTQEKDDEIYGKGNVTTAMFWEYDTRLGRRWNLDPKPTIGISEYSTFECNPVLFTDPLGDKIRGTRAEKKALKNRADWAQIKATYKDKLFKKSEKDLNLSQIKNDPRVTLDIDHAQIQPQTLTGQSSVPNQDYLYFTPLTETVKESYSFFGISGFTKRPQSKSSQNEFISGTIQISAISNVDGYGMDHLKVVGGNIGSPKATPLFEQDIPVGTAPTAPVVATINFNLNRSEKISTVWNNENSRLSGPHAGRVIIKIVGERYVDKRFR
jgi:hypothetical protein